jgi:adenine-specific DNA-methyltransferase
MGTCLPPRDGERPAAYADRAGRWHAICVSDRHKKEQGQYFTPLEVADFMAALCRPLGASVRVLDPGAGAGILSCALCESLAARPDRPARVEVVAYETDTQLACHLETCLAYAKRWLEAQRITLAFRICTDDFVISHAPALDGVPPLFAEEENHFDVVISNPPYFKIPKSDPRAAAAAAVVHGQPNIYALFMAVSATMLKPGGELVCITPRSYTAGPYFRLFRERFFAQMQPLSVHLFASREDAFRRDEVLQENIILRACRADRWYMHTTGARLEVTVSEGAADLERAARRFIPLAEALDYESRDKVLRIPASEEDDAAVRLVHSWHGSLQAYGMEISTGPIVPFRAVPLLSRTGDVPATHAPLLWMQHVTPMRVAWPVAAAGKSQYVAVNSESLPLLVPNSHYVLLRRFSSKEQARRLIAAPFIAGMLPGAYLGLENHLNYIYRPGGALTVEEACGLAALLNSRLLDTYFRSFNGNTQVSATELRAMPLPPLDKIVEIGEMVREHTGTESIEAAVTAILQH